MYPLSRIFIPPITIILALMPLGCATSQDSILLGLGIGGIVGGGFGAAAGQGNGLPKESAVVGMAVGAAIGGLAGFLQHKKMEETKLGGSFGESGPTPSLTAPRVERVWVPAQIDNNTYVEGHFQYVIGEQSRWRPGDPDKIEAPASLPNQKPKAGKGKRK